MRIYIYFVLLRFEMDYIPQISESSGRRQIFCDWRRKYVRLTAEEWVRQQMLHLLVEQMHYPKNLIAVEHSIRVGDVQKRCDAVVFDEHLQARCIIEFKREEVSITSRVADQVAVYNRRLRVEWFILSNGRETLVCHLLKDGYELMDKIPTYEQLCQKN